MVETRRDGVTESPILSDRAVEWIEDESTAADTLIGEPVHATPSRSLRWMGVAALLGFASLMVVVGVDARAEEDVEILEESASASTDATSTTIGVAPPAVVPLEPAPATLVSGRRVAWVGGDRSLVLIDLETGGRIEVPQWASLEWPPLPETARLVGSENSTFVIDTLQLEQSGQLSGSVRMVRFGFDLDRFGYVTRKDDGTTDFFVGSIWGPSSSGLASMGAATSVFLVSDRGVVISGPDGRSSTLSGFGFRALPSRIGRVVAASSSHVAGIYCDEPGRCVGRVADWEGANERQIPVGVLALETVRISPDGRYVAGSGGADWVIHDFETQTTTSISEPVMPDATMTWTDDSRALLWVGPERIVLFDVEQMTAPVGVPIRLSDELLPAVGSELVAFSE